MKIAYFDCQFGAAGDMLNAALLAAGADEGVWRKELSNLRLPDGNFKVGVTDVMRCNIACKKVDVFDESGEKLDALYAMHVQQEHHHEHEHHHHEHEHHHHKHAHDHSHEHEHEHSPGNGAHHHRHTRGLREIVEIISQSEIRAGAKSLAIRIFERLARAESLVHNVPPEEIHFHEVGAIDAIVDIVGFSIAYDLLGIQQSYASPIAIGSGKAKTEHGLFPVPGPATLNLLTEAKAAIAQSRITFECLTPTGAAILCEVVSTWGVQPPLSQIKAVGYGAGTRDPEEWPNACRVVLGEGAGTADGAAARFDTEAVAVLEANLDDLSPQALAFCMEKLFEVGALDVFVSPVVMKKGRAGQVLTVLCRPDEVSTFENLILTQTSTIGVRSQQAMRAVAGRRWEEVHMPDGQTIRIKLAFDRGGAVINMQPEYEDCAAYASSHNVPLKDVTNEVMARFLTGRQD